MQIDAEKDLASQEDVNINSEQRKAAKLKAELEKLHAEEHDCTKKLKGLNAAAEIYGERIAVTNSQESLTSKIKETKKNIT